jgi:hypothetical protein
MHPITRRELLRRLGLGGSALALGPHWLTACGGDGQGLFGGGGDDLPFSMWRELQRAVRSSPDHLPSRAARLVEAGDLEGLVALVADDVRTLPTLNRGRDRAERSVRWGPAGALRAGGGTPREKCELLANLMNRAGFEAEVRMSRRQPSVEEWQAILAPSPRPPFDPDVSDRQLARWAEALGVGMAEAPESPEPSGQLEDTARELAHRVLAVEGLNVAGPPAQDYRSGFLPVVVLRRGEEEHVVSPAEPGDRLRSLAPGHDLRDAPDMSGLWQVHARLSCVTTLDPRAPRLLVERTWSASQLIGRQIVVRTVPAIPEPLLHATSFADVATFIPLLGVRGPGLDQESTAELAALGEPFLLDGRPLDLSGAMPSFEGISLAPPGTADPASVASLEVSVDPATFPVLDVRLTARDASGQLVEGLQARDFRILEEDREVPALLTANLSSPLVVLMIDQSLSMPAAYRGEEGMDLMERLRRTVVERYPAARLAHQETNSDLWRWLGWARARSPDLTVFVTDGDLGDRLTPDLRQVLGTSGPTLFLNVKAATSPLFDELAEVTGGEVAPVREGESALSRVLAALAALAIHPYRFRTAASGPAPRDRTLRVSLADGRVEAAATYEVPEVILSGDRICGLVLTVELTQERGRSITVERTLGGYDRRFEGLPTQAHLDDAFEALWGSYLIQVEGGGTPPSVRIDDHLEGLLGMEPFMRAVVAGDDLEAFLGTDTLVPPELYALTAELVDPDEVAPVYEEGLRMVLHRMRLRFGTDRVQRAVDILPTGRIMASHPDAAVGFGATLRATAHLAATEAALYPASTLAVAGSSPLLRVGAARDLPLELDRAERIWWDHLIRGHSRRVERLVPEEIPPGRKVLWELDPVTGELLGILDDGSGGGSAEERVRRQIQEFDKVMAYYGLIFEGMNAGGAVGGLGAFSLAVVATYGQTLVKLYGAVTLVIINMDATGLDEQVRASLQQLSCNVAREAFLGGVGGAGGAAGRAASIFGSISNLLGILYADSPVTSALTC